MKRRETELDLLRVLAMAAVIWVHTGGMETGVLPTSDKNCQLLIFLKSIMTWEIPVYVMISGRFFLDPQREVSGAKLRRAISRLMAAMLAWDAVYLGYGLLTDAYAGLNWKGILSQALIGPYHFWYLYMIIGLYLITPFLRKIAEDRALARYFLLLAWIVSFLTRYAVELPFVGGTVGEMMNYAGMQFLLGYSGYYVLGFYLHRNPPSKKAEIWLYVCGGLCLVLASGANTWLSFREGAYTERYTNYLAPNTMVTAAAVYTFFVKRVPDFPVLERAEHWIMALERSSFGVYLVHALVLEGLLALGLRPTLVHPLLGMPLITLLTLAISTALVTLIRKIPVVGKKLV